MEHIIALNLSTHLNKHNILYELQHLDFSKAFDKVNLCKVMEHIIASNLSTHLNEHNILYELQLLDFSKAFDKVNHLKLLYKLSCFGVIGNTVNWIQSFLKGRTQTIYLSIFTGSLIYEHYTRECEFGNFDKIKNKKHKKNKTTQKNTKTFG